MNLQRKKSNCIFIISLIFVLAVIPSYFFPLYPSDFKFFNAGGGDKAGQSPVNQKCDLFTGEWVPNSDAPQYTNATCDAIQEHQNCLKYGRPDLDFLRWKWKPDGCDLPVFDPQQFLQLVKGKSMAFVGDSVARNHMQSLICLLTRIARPTVLGDKAYHYPDYNFTISNFFSPFLVRSEKTDPNNTRGPFNLYLDEFDDSWAAKIESFDYVIISAGQWFFHPSYFYLNRTLIGCLNCGETNVTHLMSPYSYRWAFKTSLRAINDAANFRGVAFLRTFSPSHYEGGGWDSGGDCVRTRPYKRDEIGLEYYNLEMYRVQSEEMGIARRAGKGTGGNLELFDVTKLLLLRPDGHPRKYGRWPVANQTFPLDCVHWCLPGPIDALNDLLQELLKQRIHK